ncbi:hypothetical protein [Paralimibaculum aggregatum]|nr:hypothetical protein [Limibaculum sp. NKW23]
MPQAVAAEASLSVPPPEGPDVSQLPLTAMRLRPGGGFDCSWFAMSGQQPLPEALALEAASTEIPADPRLCGLHVALRRGSLLELEARLDPPDSPGLRLALRRDGSPDPVTLWIDHARLTAPARLELVLHGTGEGAVRLSFALLPEGAAGSAGTGRQPLPAPGPAPQPETPTDPWAQIRQNPAPRLPQGGFPEGWNDLRR